LSRSSSSGNANIAESFFPDPDPADDGDDGDGWGEMGDMDDGDGDGDGDGFFDDASPATKSPSSSTTLPKRDAPSSSSKTASGSGTAAATPFGDDAEPDFAGWLAAQAQKKKGGIGGKPLPKGLTKTVGPSGKTTAAVSAAKRPGAVAKPAAKKIDMKPKETGDDDGWGDGW
jgi:SCY1-like protein 1